MRSALLWSCLIFLVGFGVISAAFRVLTIAKVAPRLTEARLAAARSLVPAHASELPEMEKRFSDDPATTLVHVVAGAAFLTFGLLQFSANVRRRHLRLHRWSGRFIIVLAVFAGLTGLWMGVVAPYSPTERAPTAVAGVMFLFTPAMAIAAVRRGDIARHREWMIRFFAIGVGVVAVRMVGPLFIWIHGSTPFREYIGQTFWAGWLISYAIGEIWIRATRLRPAVDPSFAVGSSR